MAESLQSREEVGSEVHLPAEWEIQLKMGRGQDKEGPFQGVYWREKQGSAGTRISLLRGHNSGNTGGAAP